MQKITINSAVTSGKTILNKTIDPDTYTLFVNGKTSITDYLKILEDAKQKIIKEHQSKDIIFNIK